MSATLAQLTFGEMLEANQHETARWRSWFVRQGEAVLDLPMSVAGAKSVREVLQHIFAVELRYAERLVGLKVTEYDALPIGTIGELFDIAERARGIFREYLAGATDEDLAIVTEFPTRSAGILRASKRKIFAHAMLHGVRHWAQLAMELRRQGHPTDWGHDLLLSDAIK